MNNVLLKFLDLFRGIFTLMKVDYQQLRAIVSIKLTTDNRRQGIAQKRKPNDESNYTFLWTVFFYGLFGVFIAIMLYFVSSFTASMIIFFSYIMVMIAMTLITDFSSILLDTSDNTIILPRPVDGRTLFMARITHILLYLGLLTTGLSMAPMLVVLLKFGLGTLLFFSVAIILSVVTALVMTNAVYLLIMQYASEEKLKNVINYFQIGMAVFMMAGYQLLPRFMGWSDLDNFEFTIQWWSYLVPPVWMAGMLEAWHYKIYDTQHVLLILCAVIMPIIGVYFVNRYLTPVFNRKIGSMGTSNDTRSEKIKTEKGDFINRISGWVTRNHVEKSAFALVYIILGRDRKIKLKIYPSFGYVLVFGLLFVFRSKEDFATTFEDLHNTNYHLVLLYLTFMILQVAAHEIPFTDDHKASWIYFSAPLEKPGDILLGTLKAIFVRLFIPGYLLISMVVLYIWGGNAFDDIVFGFFNNFIMLLTTALIGKKYLPLSMAPNIRSQSGNFVRTLIMTVILGLLGFAHYLLALQPFILMACIPIQIIAIYFLLKSYRETDWAEITL